MRIGVFPGVQLAIWANHAYLRRSMIWLPIWNIKPMTPANNAKVTSILKTVTA